MGKKKGQCNESQVLLVEAPAVGLSCIHVSRVIEDWMRRRLVMFERRQRKNNTDLSYDE